MLNLTLVCCNIRFNLLGLENWEFPTSKNWILKTKCQILNLEPIYFIPDCLKIPGFRVQRWEN